MARTKQVAKPFGTAGVKRRPQPRRDAKASARSKRRVKMPKEQREVRFEDTELKEVYSIKWKASGTASSAAEVDSAVWDKDFSVSLQRQAWTPKKLFPLRSANWCASCRATTDSYDSIPPNMNRFGVLPWKDRVNAHVAVGASNQTVQTAIHSSKQLTGMYVTPLEVVRAVKLEMAAERVDKLIR